MTTVCLRQRGGCNLVRNRLGFTGRRTTSQPNLDPFFLARPYTTKFLRRELKVSTNMTNAIRTTTMAAAS